MPGVLGAQDVEVVEVRALFSQRLLAQTPFVVKAR